MMRNLSRMFSLVLVAVMLMVSNLVNAQDIDTTFYDADTLSEGHMLFSFDGSDFTIQGFVARNTGDSINVEYVVYRDNLDVIKYNGVYYNRTSKELLNSAEYDYAYKYTFHYDPDFNLPIDGSTSDKYIRLYNNIDEYFVINLTFVHSQTTGIINDFTEDKNEISLYPNPVVNTLNISGEFERAVVFDMSGKMLIETESSSIDMSEFKNGVYIVNVDGVSRKVRVEK
jgi:hypothetical protein